MDALEFNRIIQGKSFRSTDGTMFKFIPDSTLQVNGSLVNMANYTIEESDGYFLLNHNFLLGTEPLVIEIDSLDTPITFAVRKRFSKDFEGTWVEVLPYS